MTQEQQPTPEQKEILGALFADKLKAKQENNGHYKEYKQMVKHIHSCTQCGHITEEFVKVIVKAKSVPSQIPPQKVINSECSNCQSYLMSLSKEVLVNRILKLNRRLS